MVQGGFRLDLLLATAKMPRSTYYYQVKQLDKPDKNKAIRAEIQAIYDYHKGNYGYRRIYLELRNRGFIINLNGGRASSNFKAMIPINK